MSTEHLGRNWLRYVWNKLAVKEITLLWKEQKEAEKVKTFRLLLHECW